MIFARSQNGMVKIGGTTILWRLRRFFQTLPCRLLGHWKVTESFPGRPEQTRCLRCKDVWVDIEEMKRRDLEVEAQATAQRAEEDRQIGLKKLEA